MAQFQFQGLDQAISLPEEYLTYDQFAGCLRFYKSRGDSSINLEDFSALKELLLVVFGVPAEFGSIPMTKENFEATMKMYEHAGTLIGNSMGYGANDAEVKKESAPTPIRGKGNPRNRKASHDNSMS